MRVHRRPRDPDLIESDPAAALRPGSAALRELVERADPGQGGGGRGRPARDDLDRLAGRPGAAQLRAHARPRDRAAGAATAGGTARRSASGWSSPPSSPGWPGGWTTPRPTGTGRCSTGSGCPPRYAADAFDDLLATMAVDKKTRGSTLRFVILNGLAERRDPQPGPGELLRSAYAAVAPGERHRGPLRRGGEGVRRPGRRPHARPVDGARAGGVGPPGPGRAHQPLPDHRRDLPRQPADAGGRHQPGGLPDRGSRRRPGSVADRGRAAGEALGDDPDRRRRAI